MGERTQRKIGHDFHHPVFILAGDSTMQWSQRLRLSLTAIVISLSGCASNAFREPTYEQLAAADYGAPVEQEDAQNLALQWLTPRLKDASSAQYQWGAVQKGYVKDAPIIGGNAYAGYVLHVMVNAKNSYGAYIGFEDYTFLIRNGSISRAYHQSGIPIE